MADRFRDFQYYGLFSQQPQRPVGESFRRLAQSQRDDLGLLHSIKNLTTNPTFGVAIECDLEPLGHEVLANKFHGSGTAVERLGDFDISPTRAIGVRLQEDLSASHLLRRDVTLLNQPVQRLSLRIRQPNDILLLHDPTLLGWAKNDHNHPNTLPEITSVTKH